MPEPGVHYQIKTADRTLWKRIKGYVAFKEMSSIEEFLLVAAEEKMDREGFLVDDTDHEANPVTKDRKQPKNEDQAEDEN